MTYKKIFSQYIKDKPNTYLIHLWTDDNQYHKIEWRNKAYIECSPTEATHYGLKGEPLKTIYDWDKTNPNLHFHDMVAHQKFLIEKYGINDEPSKNHREVFFDIEIEMGGALTPEYIRSAPKPVTSIAWYDKQLDQWGILILDKKNQLKHTKAKNKEIIPVSDETELLIKWIEKIREIDPDILIGFNSDYFDIPYLYYRINYVLGPEWVTQLSPIGQIKDQSEWNPDAPIEIAGINSLDYMLLHKKYSWKDEPSYKLDFIGEKYVGINKIEYEGSLDRLFEEDINKFIQYNFRDVEILKLLDEKLQYISLTKNLAHKGKIKYNEVYASSKIHDGAISAYLLSQNIIPPPKDRNPIVKQNYAGGYLFCPMAGLYKYVFDEDLTSLYPSIIMTLNIGRETLIGRIIDDNDRNNRLGLNDLENMDPEHEIEIENSSRKRTSITIKKLISLIKENQLTISANGTFFKTDKPSVLSTILNKWFDERIYYKDEMKKAYKNGDSLLGEAFHLKQYTMKILLNSLYGALALKGFRYGNVILSEAVTLSGQRIIQESALCANNHMNKIMKDNNFKEEFLQSL